MNLICENLRNGFDKLTTGLWINLAAVIAYRPSDR